VSDDLTQSTPIEPVGPAMPAPRRSTSGRWLNLLLVVAAAVAIGGIAFAVGRGTAPAAARFGQGPNGAIARDPNGSFAPGGPNGGGFLAAGGLTVEGTVESVTGDTMTIKTADGRTVEVTLGSDTEYHQQAAGSAADVTTGSKVAVQLDVTGRGPGQGGTAGGDGAATGPTGTASDVTVIP
jgi:hypothetical protein